MQVKSFKKHNWTISNLNTVSKSMVDNAFSHWINSQLNAANVSIIKIDLSFLEAPQPSGDN